VETPTSPGVEPLVGARGDGADAARLALIERDQAWKRAAQAIGDARAGYGSVLLFEGPSGVGKSGLIAAICALAGESGMQILSAAGRRRETNFPFGVVLELMDDYVRRAKADEPQTANVEPRVGSLSDAIRKAAAPFAPGERAAPSPEESFYQLRGLYTLCATLAATSPVAILVDDADLADEASLRFLLYLTERLAELPILVVLSAGNVAPRRAPQLLGYVARHSRTSRCRLEPLSREGTGRRVSKRSLSGAADAAAAEIHLATGGLPLLVDSLVAAMAAQEPEPPPQVVAELVPAGVADWAIVRAAELDPRAPSVLSALAVLGQACELRHASALAGLPPETTGEIVDGLVDVGILLAGEGLSFAQPVVAAAVASAQPRSECAEMHLRAAQLLAEDVASPEQVARHLLLATRRGDAWTVNALCTAAAMALDRGDPFDAIRYLRRALAEPPDPGTRANVFLELGRAEAMAGEPQAATHLRDGAIHLTSGPDRPRAAVRTGRVLFALGHPEHALAMFERGLESAKDADPELAGLMRAGHATAVWLTELPNGATLDEPPPERADTAGDRALLALHAIDGAVRGMPSSKVRALAEAALGKGALLEDETADGITYYLAAWALTIAEDLLTAEAVLTAAVDDARSRGSVLGFASASQARAVTTLIRGRLSDAANDARHALAVERHGWRLGRGQARMVLASRLIARGDLDGATRYLDAADSAAGEPELFRLAGMSARGRLRLVRGDSEGALQQFLALGDLADRMGVVNPAIAPWRSGAGQALVAVGDRREAERLIGAELSIATELGAPGPIGRSLRLLALTRDTEPALDVLEAAVDTLQGSQMALERARAFVDFGAALRRSGRRRDAREPLKEGLELAQRCGAEVLAKRAMGETKAAGARPRRTAVHGRDALTTRERQVASLAADGLSNRQIAETLFVTVKTVEWHLQHSYRKLGLDSRKHLREALGEAPDASASSTAEPLR
jgi:DNA-binding CsgD family transcriptional regulator